MYHNTAEILSRRGGKGGTPGRGKGINQAPKMASVHHSYEVMIASINTCRVGD